MTLPDYLKDERWLNTAQVAELISVTPRTIKAWRELKEGPPYSRMRDSDRSPVRYQAKLVIEWMESRRVDFAIHYTQKPKKKKRA